ncbi:MAG: heavy-metal-associated domain-containing protein [Reyranella sp.]|uniref:Copper chaperone CopZ n=1 Tax=Enhydrobacter aerosaccus TaxID=225324 RepID=A0A1T4SKQ8_9HYPH|nr:heavy metal-associated domain-containing protein [Enhydrobacter aerosaccus]KAF0102115.1 MAG: cation translocating P-type ATPase [Rhodospirillaceae bacterium]TBR30055.1 MAG: heavy-metal-associated domain-containing protein [Reyranella sp.]SKA28777.1 Copper chaperone CopZ [Enhydrobacter aerosaccus]
MKSATFKIEGMNCDGCAGRIKALAEKLPGVQAATVSFSQAEACILFNPQTVTEDRLVALVHDAGFRVVAHE